MNQDGQSVFRGHGFSGVPMLHGRRPRVCLISLSPVLDDPRVRRQGDAFSAAGWQVFAAGLPGGKSPPPAWPIVTPEILDLDETDRMKRLAEIDAGVSASAAPSHGLDAAAPLPAAPRLIRFAARSVLRLMKDILRGHPLIGRFEEYLCNFDYYWQHIALHWRPRDYKRLYFHDHGMRRFAATLALIDADVYLANDWHGLPQAMRAAAAKQAAYGYDSHEYALEEYGHSWKWRLLRRPFARATEADGIRNAVVISCVSEGIAVGMQQAYKMPSPPLVIRNASTYVPGEARPCGSPITVLYHGIIVPTRGIEDSIVSVKSWRPEFRYHLRGPVGEPFRATLDSLIKAHGLENRVEILPPVPMLDMVAHASMADIGISNAPFLNKHNSAALPNKFFEYIQAGLALVVPATGDMKALVDTHGLGLALADVSPDGIAAAINSLTPEAISRFKKQARYAAETLNWETESARLIQVYEAALGVTRIDRNETAA